MFHAAPVPVPALDPLEPRTLMSATAFADAALQPAAPERSPLRELALQVKALRAQIDAAPAGNTLLQSFTEFALAQPEAENPQIFSLPDPLPPRVDRLPITDADTRSANYIAHFPIGHSSINAANRRVGWNLAEQGWDGFVENQIQPVIDSGVRRIMLHNPFGVNGTGAMQFDQYTEAQDAGLDWLTDGFVEAWKPITDSGVQVIGYIGSPRLDPDSRVFEDAGDWAGFLAFAAENTDPLVAAGMDVGYDAAGVAHADSFTARYAEVLEGGGTEILVEPRPSAGFFHWYDNAVISTVDFWEQSDPRLNPRTAGGAASTDDLRGEIILLDLGVNGTERWEDLDLARTKVDDIYAQGFTPATTYYQWLRHGTDNLNDLVNP